MRLFRGISKHCAPPVPPERTVRQLTSARTGNNLLPEGFTFFSSFFDVHEQRILLTTALSQLDATESIRVRRLQSDYRARNPVSDSAPVEGVFLPDRYYTFHEGHYDNVILDYREMRLSSWPESELRGLTPVLDRLRALYPSKDTQTHLLHLASSGEILPHVDNASASGEWILGVSLGATRTLRMESPNSTESESFDIVLPSGSVYLQKDDIRYRWKHAILPSTDKEKARCGQRISIMIRNHGGITQGRPKSPDKAKLRGRECLNVSTLTAVFVATYSEVHIVDKLSSLDYSNTAACWRVRNDPRFGFEVKPVCYPGLHRT